VGISGVCVCVEGVGPPIGAGGSPTSDASDSTAAAAAGAAAASSVIGVCVSIGGGGPIGAGGSPTSDELGCVIGLLLLIIRLYC
jgi:hypothetical protein